MIPPQPPPSSEPAGSVSVLFSALCFVAAAVAGGYWALTNANYSACQSALTQSLNQDLCTRVLTYHPLAGVAALLALAGGIALFVTARKPGGSRP
jgi:hypothetical protein